MKILLVQTGFLGDVVLSTPTIASLRKLYPQAELFFMTTPDAAELVQHHPELKEILIFDKRRSMRGMSGLLKMSALLREKQFQIVFSLHKSWRTALLLWLARIPKRYGFSEASGQMFYTQTAPRRDLAHEVLRNLAIFRNVGEDPEHLESNLHIELSEVAKNQATELLKVFEGMPILGVAPGSVWATKRWTKEGFSEVVRNFSQRGFGVVLLGGERDRILSEEIEREAGVQCLNLCGSTSLLVSVAVIKCLELLLANDTAPLHMASAVQTPVVALFCATVPEFGYTPWKVPSRILGVEGLSCRPCGRHGGEICPTGTHACQKNLLPLEVISGISNLLEFTRRSQSGLTAGTTSE